MGTSSTNLKYELSLVTFTQFNEVDELASTLHTEIDTDVFDAQLSDTYTTDTFAPGMRASSKALGLEMK